MSANNHHDLESENYCTTHRDPCSHQVQTNQCVYEGRYYFGALLQLTLHSLRYKSACYLFINHIRSIHPIYTVIISIICHFFYLYNNRHMNVNYFASWCVLIGVYCITMDILGFNLDNLYFSGGG